MEDTPTVAIQRHRSGGKHPSPTHDAVKLASGSDAFMTRWKSMKMKRRNTKYRSLQADAQHQSIQEASAKMKIAEEQANLVAFTWKQELRNPSDEFLFCKATGRSLTRPCIQVTKDVGSNTVILLDPTIDSYANDFNKVTVKSVDFIAHTITFEDEHVQSAWELVKHLFEIQSLEFTYEVEKQRKGKYERWVIGDCLSEQDIGFFRRIHRYEMDSEVDHSAFISLCHTKLSELDLYRFDKSCVQFIDGTEETARLAHGTLKLIAIKPTTSFH